MSKVFLVHHYGGVGGGTTSAIDIACMFKALGYDITIGITSPSDKVRQLVEDAEIALRDDIPPVVSFTYHNAARGQLKAFVKYAFSFKYYRQWKEYLNKEKPDILVLNSSEYELASTILTFQYTSLLLT